ncbi:hypothetical protein [Leifsonia sp. NPDC080035]|uniref:Lipoprotein n=1 Tax=Leifsonia sp. NPDC080035 TaxID=3143936 RepID=A0AAU7GF31_9MICO
MKNISLLRAAIALAMVGVLAGCSGGGSASHSKMGPTSSASAATYTATDVEAIIAHVNTELSLDGTVLDTTEMKAATDTAVGLSALTKSLPSGATIEPAACNSLEKLGTSNSQSKLDTTAMLQFGTQWLTVGTVAGRQLPSDLTKGMPAAVKKLLKDCSSITMTSGSVSMDMKLSQIDVTTTADNAWGLTMSFGTAGMQSTMTVVTAVSGNLSITAMTADSNIPGASTTNAPTVAPAELIDAAIAAAK